MAAARAADGAQGLSLLLSGPKVEKALSLRGNDKCQEPLSLLAWLEESWHERAQVVQGE